MELVPSGIERGRIFVHISSYMHINKLTQLHGLSPRANYADRAPLVG
jgi:hypothetical protein